MRRAGVWLLLGASAPLAILACKTPSSEPVAVDAGSASASSAITATPLGSDEPTTISRHASRKVVDPSLPPSLPVNVPTPATSGTAGRRCPPGYFVAPERMNPQIPGFHEYCGKLCTADSDCDGRTCNVYASLSDTGDIHFVPPDGPTMVCAPK